MFAGIPSFTGSSSALATSSISSRFETGPVNFGAFSGSGGGNGFSVTPFFAAVVLGAVILYKRWK